MHEIIIEKPAKVKITYITAICKVKLLGLFLISTLIAPLNSFGKFNNNCVSFKEKLYIPLVSWMYSTVRNSTTVNS